MSAAGIDLSLRIGQHVRHGDFHGKRVTGVVRGLSVDTEDVLYADILLDEPIVIPALGPEDHDLPIYRQHVPAHELAAFDERDELLANLAAQRKVAVDLLREVVGPLEVSAAVIESEDGGGAIETLLANVKRCVEQFDRAAIATATGSKS